VDGVFTAPLVVASDLFGAPLRDAGIAAVSDDIVLMAYNHFGGLKSGQTQKREQVLTFQKYIRSAMEGHTPFLGDNDGEQYWMRA
jgi:hypothetical protein